MGYDSPQFENPCNTDRHIKMEIPILAGEPVSPRITQHIEETGTKMGAQKFIHSYRKHNDSNEHKQCTYNVILWSV